MGELSDLKLEEVLGREVVEADKELLGSFLSGKKVLVTGAAGSIGSEISRQVLEYSVDSLILLDQDEFGIYELDESLGKDSRVKTYLIDIKQSEILNQVFEKEKPDVVFHAAAYKHVPILEKNREVAVLNNVLGTKNVFDASKGAEKVVLISTDKAVKPESFMGKTKKAAEILAGAYNKEKDLEVVTVRFGNVFGSSGSVAPYFWKQIKNGGPVTITDPEMERFFMSIKEACLLVLEVASIGKGGSTYVLDMGSMVKVKDLALGLIKFSGRDVEIEYTKARPGEKLKESLIEEYESLKEASQRKISEVVSSKDSLSMEEALKYIEDVSRIK